MWHHEALNGVFTLARAHEHVGLYVEQLFEFEPEAGLLEFFGRPGYVDVAYCLIETHQSQSLHYRGGECVVKGSVARLQKTDNHRVNRT